MRSEVVFNEHSLGEFDHETSLKLVGLLTKTREFASVTLLARPNSYEQELNGTDWYGHKLEVSSTYGKKGIDGK